MQTIIDHKETESQTSSVGRRSEIFDILKIFENNSGNQIFFYFYVGIGLIFFTIALCVSVQFVATDVKWLRSSDSNIVDLTNTYYSIEYYVSSFISKGLVLYGIEKGIVTGAEYSEQIGKPNY